MRLRPCSLPVASLAAMLLAACGYTSLCAAQTKAQSPQAAEATAKAAQPGELGPRWSELSAEQHSILQSLQNLWPALEENSKRKWLAIAKKFPDLSPQAQAMAQERMREWAALTPAQRYQARLHFAQSQKFSPDEKIAKWEAYQSLNDEQKNKLSQAQPAWSKGAAMAVRPVAPEKITVTPNTRKEGQEKPPRIETAEVNPQTLLPLKKRNPVDKP
ncbi:MAG: DUF3106 domain-containing protein [Limnohabitans sp.]|nr:DUF3106 domain-containing protein [Limnohabitans sp.]